MSQSTTYEVTVGGAMRRVTVTLLAEASPSGGARFGVSLDDGPERVIDMVRPVPDVLSLLIGDDCWEAGLVRTDDGYDVEVLGVRHEVGVVDPRRKPLRLSAGAAGGALHTRMPGRIVRLLCQEGDTVARGQPLVVVEAMKMENELKAPIAGKVKRVRVQPGDLVESKAILVEIG